MKKNSLVLLSGNEAIFFGALTAGLNFCAGYPITPSSEIMELAAQEALKRKNFHFIQSEDELASVNATIGAALGGVKAMTATSGPGFSLMQEAIGMAFMAKIPIVIVDVQRVGPATGMPTYPAQGDVLQAFHGSHGDYFSLVFSFSSVEECYLYTIFAFNLSQQLCLPVIILSDAYLAHLYETVDLRKFKHIKIVPAKFRPFGSGKRHLTGLLAKNGRLKTGDHLYYQQWLKERKKEIFETLKDYRFFDYLPNKKSGKLLISYGTTARLVEGLRKDFAILKLIRLFPVLAEEIKEIAKDYQEILCCEMNDGQYGLIVEAVLKREIKKVKLLGGKIDYSYLKEAIYA